MSYIPVVIEGQTFVGEAPALLARIETRAGAALTQAAVSSIAYDIYDLDESTVTPTYTGSLEKTDVIFDTYQTDYQWTDYIDSTGYNFRWICPGGNFDTAGHTFRIEVVITDTSANTTAVVFEIEAVHLYSEE